MMSCQINECQAGPCCEIYHGVCSCHFPSVPIIDYRLLATDWPFISLDSLRQVASTVLYVVQLLHMLNY